MYMFNNKHFLVTGANSGIGRCVSGMLIAGGAVVFMVDKNTDNIKQMALEASNGSDYLEFDLSQPANVEEVFEKAKSKGIRFDGMVYCAGISPLMTLKDFSLETFRLTQNINVVSFVSMLSFFMDSAYTNDNSSIVGISSSTSVYGGNRQYAYSSSKAAMNLIVKSTAKELATRKTRINTVMPSITNSEMVSRLRTQSDAIDMNVKYKMPFGILEPDDVSKVILYLLSDESSAVSGILMPVNNGEIY